MIQATTKVAATVNLTMIAAQEARLRRVPNVRTTMKCQPKRPKQRKHPRRVQRLRESLGNWIRANGVKGQRKSKNLQGFSAGPANHFQLVWAGVKPAMLSSVQM